METKSFSQLPLLPDSFAFLVGTGPFPSYPLWTISTSLPRSQPSFVLLFMQEKTEGEFFLQYLWTPPAGSDLPPPGLFSIWASPARHLWHYTSSIFDLWSRLQLCSLWYVIAYDSWLFFNGTQQIYVGSKDTFNTHTRAQEEEELPVIRRPQEGLKLETLWSRVWCFTATPTSCASCFLY